MLYVSRYKGLAHALLTLTWKSSRYAEPSAMKAMKSHKSPAPFSVSGRARGRFSIAIAVLLGMGLTLATHYVVQAWETDSIDSEFARRANNHAVTLQSTIDRHVELLESMAGLFYASQHVDRNDFRVFVQPLLDLNPEVQGYSWNPLIREGEREDFVKAAREDGLPDFRVTEVGEGGEKVLAANGSEHVAVYYLEPLSGNEKALGFDISSEAKRREALEISRDSGQPAATRWIRLVQETQDQFGILMIRPIYAKRRLFETTEQRRSALRGYVVGVFRVGDMIEAALRPADPAGLDFWVYQGAAPEFPAISYFHPSRSRVGEDTTPKFTVSEHHDGRHLTRVLNLPGRQWSIVYKPAPALLAAHSQHAATGVLLGGTTLTALLAFYLLSILRESERAAVLNNQLKSTNEDLEREVSEHEEARDRINHMAFHDALTNLPNRELLHDRLEHAIELALRSEALVGVMFLDIDRFKTVNDTLGHSVGDGLLIQIAHRLKSKLREADTVARFGGDEFVVIAEGISGEKQLEAVAQSIIDCIAKPFDIDGKELYVTTSIGITIGTHTQSDVDALIAQADIAMYSAKESGRNTYRFHTPDMGERISQRASIENDLRGALEREELLFHYQPLLDTGTRKSIGMEALMRWQHARRGLVNPATFIPVMEDSGMIVPASRWMLQQTCRFLSEIHKTARREVSVAVNFSAPCFYDSGITEFIRQTMEDCGVEPKHLIIEITESTLFRDPHHVRPILTRIKAMGLRIALDDFGTGQSSLSHLRNFPIDIVKIDREFIRDVPVDEKDCELVSAIIAMAHNLSMRVVAEGVENEAQLRFLSDRGCDTVQGYLFSPPLPQDEILAYLLDTPFEPTADPA